MPRRAPITENDQLIMKLEELIPHRRTVDKRTNFSLADLRKIQNMARHGMFENRIFGVMGIPKSTWDICKRKGRELLDQYDQDDDFDLDSLRRNDLCYLHLAYSLRVGMPEAIARVEENLREIAEVKDHRHVRAIELYLRTRDPEHYRREILEHHHITDPTEMTDERKDELKEYLGEIFRYNGHGDDDGDEDEEATD